MSVFTDLLGSITAGKFYHDILTRPAKTGWMLYLLLITCSAIVLTVYWGVKANSYADEAVEFFAGLDAEIVFEKGIITNMPLSHKEYYFKDLTIYVDSKYVDLQSTEEDMENAEKPVVFIGAKAAYLTSTERAEEIAYPPAFSETIDLDYLKKTKSILIAGAFFGGFLVWLLIKFIESMAYIALIITPILLFKFRRRGLTYPEGFGVGLYLATFQIILSTILLLVGFAYIWVHLIFILLYVFFIGAYVNIDLSHSNRQLYKESASQ